MRARVGVGLLVATPLWWSPISVELAPQHAAVVGLAMAFVAPGASWFALASAALALAATACWPEGAWELAALGLAPLAAGAVRGVARDPATRGRLLAAMAGVASTIALLALAQRAGLPVFEASQRAVVRDGTAATATLGNPNHVAAVLAIALPLVGAWAPDGRARVLRGAAIVITTAAVIATASHLGLVALVAVALVYTVGVRRGIALGALVVPLALAIVIVPGAGEALAGRGYLAAVQLADLDARGWLVGHGPGSHAASFLEAQAQWLAAHPEDIARWTHPGFPHADPVGLVASIGLAGLALVVGIAAWRVRWAPVILPRAAAASAVAIAIVALGSTVIWMPAVWSTALVALALATRGRDDRAAPRLVGALVGLAWAGLLAAVLAADVLRARAIARGQAGDLDGALAAVEDAAVLPFAAAQRGLVHGRILLERGDAAGALPYLEAAAAALPHPTVLDTLVAAELAARGAARPATRRRRAWIDPR